MKFQLLKMKKPQYAQALMEHLKLHEQRIAEKAQEEIQQMIQAGGGGNV